VGELGSELGITLIYLYPKATRPSQTLDVTTFRPLKLGWKTTILEWHRQTFYKILHKELFFPFLERALKKYSLEC